MSKFDLETIRHSAAHVMAAAVKQLYPDARFDIGPATETGFYYDFDMEHRLVAEDLKEIEKVMKKIIGRKLPFERFEATRDEAKELLAGQNYKLERLADIEDVMNRRLTKLIEDNKRSVTVKADALERTMERRLEHDKKRLALASTKLWGLSPLKKLGQGYGFVTDDSGERLASVKQAPAGSRIRVQVADGKLTAMVEKSEEAESWRG